MPNTLPSPQDQHTQTTYRTHPYGNDQSHTVSCEPLAQSTLSGRFAPITVTAGQPMGNVLFVDDELNSLLAVRRNFRDAFQIDASQSACEALNKIDEGHQYDVVISDLKMPQMDGLTFLKHVRTRLPNAALIILTGHAQSYAPIDAINTMDIFRFLIKPCDPHILWSSIREGLHTHSMKLVKESQEARKACTQFTSDVTFSDPCADLIEAPYQRLIALAEKMQLVRQTASQ
jgi:DNA-binding NtrC family response regulator